VGALVWRVVCTDRGATRSLYLTYALHGGGGLCGLTLYLSYKLGQFLGATLSCLILEDPPLCVEDAPDDSKDRAYKRGLFSGHQVSVLFFETTLQ
jgi:hypothetical protein